MGKTKKNTGSGRTRIRAELSNFNLSDIETRDKHEPEIFKNRFTRMIELNKREKLLREERKTAKMHVGHRRDLAKRFQLEMELQEPLK